MRNEGEGEGEGEGGSASPQPLAGMRALDLTDIEGQLCGRLLADLGMEVLKVEPPGGDSLRNAATGSAEDAAGGAGPAASPAGALFVHLNAGKRSVALDLRSAAGVRRFDELLAAADVVLDSGSPTALGRAGLDRAWLLGRHPRVVYAAVTGWGLDGPLAARPYSDLTVQAASGWLALSGEPGRPPCRPPELQAFYFGSLCAALGVVAALRARGRDGRGDWIDVSMQECLAAQEHMVRLASLDHRAVVRSGSQHATVSPATIYPCSDGHVFLYITVKHWKLFLQVWDEHPAELESAEWDANDYRRARAALLNERVGAWTRTMTREQFVRRMQDVGIPCLQVNTPAEFAADEQTVERRFVQEVAHPSGLVLRQPAAPFLMGGVRPPVRPASALGEGADGWSAGDSGGTGAANAAGAARAGAADAGGAADAAGAAGEGGTAGEGAADAGGAAHAAGAAGAGGTARAGAVDASGTAGEGASDAGGSGAPEAPPAGATGPSGGSCDAPASGGSAETRAGVHALAAGAAPAGRPLPLAGLRVLGFDQVLAGPFATQLLCLLGADVVKVESKRGGLDQFRFFGDRSDLDSSPRFLEFNRNKKSVTLNLKRAEGRDLVLRLAARADIVLDNFSAHVMPSLGLDHEHLRRVRPDIVVLRMPGLGATGPKREFASVGNTITAFTGLTHLWSLPGRGEAPVGSQVVYPDYVSGVLAATACVAAVLGRRPGGGGAHIDLSQAEAAAYMIGATLIQALLPGTAVGPAGNRSALAAPEGCYPCRGDDAWCAVSVCDDRQWQALVEACGLPTLRDARFVTAAQRRSQADELDEALSAWTRRHEAPEVERLLAAAGVPCSAVRTGLDVVADPHLQARGYFVPVDHPRFGRFALPRLPLVFGRHASRTDWEFPVLGRHNREVLRGWLGLDDGELERLVADGVVA